MSKGNMYYADEFLHVEQMDFVFVGNVLYMYVVCLVIVSRYILQFRRFYFD